MYSANIPVAWRTRLQVNRSYQDYWQRRRLDARNRRRAKKLSRINRQDHEIEDLVEISDSEDAGAGYNHYRHCDFRNNWKISTLVRSKLGNSSREILNNDAGRVSSTASQVNIQCISSDSELQMCPSNDGGEVNESESARQSSPSMKEHQRDRLLRKEDGIDGGRVEDRISTLLFITLSDDEQEPKEDPSANERREGDDWKWKGRPLKKRYKFDDEQKQQQPDEQECPGLPMNSSLEDMDANDKLLKEMNLALETQEIGLIKVKVLGEL